MLLIDGEGPKPVDQFSLSSKFATVGVEIGHFTHLMSYLYRFQRCMCAPVFVSIYSTIFCHIEGPANEVQYHVI